MTTQAPKSWVVTSSLPCAVRLRESAVEVLQPHQGENLPDYLHRIQGSTPAVLFRTLQRIVGKKGTPS